MTSGEDVVGGKRPSKKYNTRNRVCAQPECSTILSAYNPGIYCSGHERNARERLAPPSSGEG